MSTPSEFDNMYRKMIVCFGIIVHELDTCSVLEFYSIIYWFGNLSACCSYFIIHSVGPTHHILPKPLPKHIVNDQA